MIKVKICGNRDHMSALAAAEAGADFVGFVFVRGSRRRLPPGKELDVIEAFRKARDAKRPRIVGLFANQPLDEVLRWTRECHLEAVQLCGKEPLDYCARIRVPVIKVVHVRGRGNREKLIEKLDKELTNLDQEGMAILLDRHEPGLFGGAGKPFDWAIAAELRALGHQFILAGGLNPENVGDAVRTVQPWGVDVSSGVETEGAKDPEKVRDFIRAVRDAETDSRIERLRDALERLHEGQDD